MGKGNATTLILAQQGKSSGALHAHTFSVSSGLPEMTLKGADGDMVPGDVIEVEISGIGTLRTYVVAAE
jgi:2-keto-4-pentenoate hydratase/2-oxohepta-3-ene-1,7-dioic acid hydratase in catechol pathway